LLAQILGDAFACELIDLLLDTLHVLLDEFAQLFDRSLFIPFAGVVPLVHASLPALRECQRAYHALRIQF